MKLYAFILFGLGASTIGPGLEAWAQGGLTPDQLHVYRPIERLKKYHWYSLTDQQYAALMQALNNFKPGKPIVVMSGTPDSLELAEDFDSAFQSMGLESQLDNPSAIVDGAHTNSPALANLITAATGIKVQVDPDNQDIIALNFGRKHAQ